MTDLNSDRRTIRRQQKNSGKMHVVVLIVRSLLGLLFIAFGLNTFLWAVSSNAFMPPPPPESMPASAVSFQKALTDTGFMHPLRGAVECVAGLLIVSGAMAPLGLVLLAPVLVHIVFYHHFLDPTGTGFSYAIVVMWGFLVFAYWPSFRGIVTIRPRSRWQQSEDISG